MVAKAKRARTAETLKQPSLGLKLRALYLYLGADRRLESLSLDPIQMKTTRRRPPMMAILRQLTLYVESVCA
jgi:hypothetical protein